VGDQHNESDREDRSPDVDPPGTEEDGADDVPDARLVGTGPGGEGEEDEEGHGEEGGDAEDRTDEGGEFVDGSELAPEGVEFARDGVEEAEELAHGVIDIVCKPGAAEASAVPRIDADGHEQ